MRISDWSSDVCSSDLIIGNTIVQNLFRGADPVGQRFRIRNTACEVIGVLATRGQGGFGNDQDDVVIMPLKTVQRRFTGNQHIRSIMVAVATAYETSDVPASLTRSVEHTSEHQSLMHTTYSG